ncbi:hypothetical protein KAM479_27110 [Aeromonas caviae]|nr:hypothetical protein KAM479_27110 [Aeromonas caviae]
MAWIDAQRLFWLGFRVNGIVSLYCQIMGSLPHLALLGITGGLFAGMDHDNIMARQVGKLDKTGTNVRCAYYISDKTGAGSPLGCG